MQTLTGLDLSPFRRRIRLLRAWRCGAIGGVTGAAAAIVLATLDYFDVVEAEPWALAALLLGGIAAGVFRAAFERLPNTAVARSVDRRGALQDRLTSAAELPADGGLAQSLHEDARVHAAGLQASRLYPIRVGRWQAALLGLAALSAFVYLLGNSLLFRSPAAKKDAIQLRQAAQDVQRVAQPLLDDAKRPDADPAEKELARQIRTFGAQLQKGRMSRAQALVRANALAAQARALEQTRIAGLAESVQAAQSAGQRLQALAAQAGLEKSDAAKLAGQAQALQSKIASLQQQMAAQPAGAAGSAKKAGLAQQLAAAKKQLQQIQLSAQAQALLQRLQAQPDYQEAQKLLAQLAAHAQAQQSGQTANALSPEQLKEIADRLDQLAKQYGTDAQARELARQMLAAARAARLAQNGQLSAGLMGAFGLGQAPSSGGLSLGAQPGAGAPSPDKWVGAHGDLMHSDKSSLLHVPLADRQITSQIGPKGPSSYTEVTGPSALTGKSSVPYQAVLPQYEKTAEAALDKGDVPPQLRGKVRNYFDALRH